MQQRKAQVGQMAAALGGMQAAIPKASLSDSQDGVKEASVAKGSDMFIAQVKNARHE